MSDIFISYAREDRDWVSLLAAALSRQGWNVWWDRSIAIGRNFDEVIETELAAARAVIVVWSGNSVDSRWVRAEAQEGLDDEKLIPVFQESVRPPLIFRSIHAANLVGWTGSEAAAEFRKLVADIELLTDPTPAKSDKETAPPPPPPGNRSWLGSAKRIVAAASILIVVVIALILFQTRETPDTDLPGDPPNRSSPAKPGERNSDRVDTCEDPNPPIECLFR
jgi:hypothetical protein